MRILFAGIVASILVTSTWAAPSSDGSISLLELYCEARTQDPQILSARYRALSDQARQDEAFGQLLPQLSANAQINRTRRSGDVPTEYYNNQRYTLSLSQHIYNKPVWENYNRFKYMARQGELEAEDIQAEAAVELARRYFTVLASYDELELIEAELRTTQKSLDQAEAMLTKQRIPKNEALQLQARVATLHARTIEAQNQVTLGLEALTELVGRSIAESLRPIRSDVKFSAPQEPMDTWVQRTLINNKALLAQGYGVEAAEAAVREGRGGHYPSVSLNVSSQRSDVGYDNVTAPRTNSFIASVNVNVPIFSGGSTHSRYKGLYNDMLSSKQSYEAIRRQLVKESTSAYLTLQSSVNKIDALHQAKDAAYESRIASEAMFARNLINAVDMLSSVEQEYTARRDLLQTHYDFIINRLMLSRWAGAFSEQSIFDVNVWLEGATPKPTSDDVDYQCN